MEDGPLPSLEEIQNITDINEAKALLLATVSYEKKIEQDLESFLQNSSELESRLESVEDIPIKLGPVYREAKRLSSTISDTCNLAEAVSSKVRELDVTRERLKNTLTKMHDIIDVKNCVNGVQKAMEQEDYETAAAHINRYLHIDKSVLEESAGQQLKSSEQKLKEIVRRKLDQSIRANDQDNILRFCKLYTPLGLKEEGLTAYSHYLRRLIAAEADYVLKHISRAGDASSFKVDAEAMVCSDGLSRLFEFIARLIEERQQLVEEHFSESGMLTVLVNLQQECDTHATKILNAFITDNQISRLVEEIGRARKKSMRKGILISSMGPKDAEALVIEPRDLAELLDNIAILNQRTELYDRFIKRKAVKAKAALEEEIKALSEGGGTANEGEKQDPAVAHQQMNLFNPVLHCSELKRKIQEMMSDYIALEEYFMVQSVKKAVAMDERVEDSLTSSMVDYVFFVLKKCTQRVLSTCNIDTVCAIINLINATLNIDFREVLQNMLAEYSQGKGPTADQKTDYLMVLNNLEVSSEYIIKLKAELEAECHIFTENTQREKIKSCLHDLTETSKNYKQLLQNNLEQVAQTNTPSIRPLIDLFVQVNYTLEEAEYAEYEINDPFVQRFISGLETLFSPFKTHLTESNYDSLIHIVIRMIVHRLEKAVLQKKFNQLGALQFDKDLRLLVGYFSGIMQKTVRGEFARLNQMASILNLEKVNEVMDYWGENSGQMTWRLTPGEVRRVLSRRVEFKSNEIAQLKL